MKRTSAAAGRGKRRREDRERSRYTLQVRARVSRAANEPAAARLLATRSQLLICDWPSGTDAFVVTPYHPITSRQSRNVARANNTLWFSCTTIRNRSFSFGSDEQVCRLPYKSIVCYFLRILQILLYTCVHIYNSAIIYWNLLLYIIDILKKILHPQETVPLYFMLFNYYRNILYSLFVLSDIIFYPLELIS